jgi:hypothetical protein
MRLIALLCICIFLFGCQPKNKELKLQLIRLQSALKTGTNARDFKARVADLRTAYQLHGNSLTSKQDEMYRKIDRYCQGCIYFRNEYESGGQYPVFGSSQKQVADEMGVAVNADTGIYNPYGVCMTILRKVEDSTSDLLNQMK